MGIRASAWWVGVWLTMLNGVASAQSHRLDSIVNLPFDVLSSHLDASERALQGAYAQCLKTGEPEKRAKAAKQLSTVHYLKGAYDSSAYYILEAIHAYEKLGLPSALGHAYCEYGYRIKRRNLKEAFAYMSKGISILEANQCTKELTGAYDNYGVLFELKQVLDSASYFYQRALDLKIDLRDSIGLPYSLNNLGGVQILRGNYKNAMPYLQQALDIRTARNDAFGMAESHALLGDLHMAWGKYQEAVQFYLLSANACERMHYPFLLQQNQEQLANCYEKLGQFDLATKALRWSAAIKDSLLSEKNMVQVNELEQRFKLAEKDKSIAQWQEKDARRQLAVVWISGVLLLAVAVFLLFVQRQKRKSETARDAAIIAERERGLVAVFEATEEERKRIAKDLHDGIGQQLSGLRMGFESLHDAMRTALPQQAQTMEQLTQVIDEACHDVRSLSHQMMPKALAESGLIAAMDDMLHKSLGLSSIQYRLEHFKVDGVRFPERIEIGLYRVCQELINNIIKHSGASEVAVQLFRSKGWLIMIVEDNGRGFLHSPNQEGIGLSNVTSRIHTVDGEVSWEPGPQCGTVATIKVPVSD